MGEIFKRHSGYSLRWYEGGRRRVLASKQTSHADAKRMLIEIEARVARGEAGIPERRTDFPTMAELTERFFDEYSRPKLKDIERYRAVARSLLRKAASLGTLRVHQIQPADVAKLRDLLLRRHAPGTVRNVLRQLGTMFAWAVKGGLCPHNPCGGIERPTAGQTLDFFSKEEVRRLLCAVGERKKTAMGSMLEVAVRVALHTGLRKGELLGLRWVDLDLETRRLTVARSYRSVPKSGKPRHLRLPQALLPLLTSWRPLCPQSPEGAVLPLGRDGSRIGGPESMLGLPRLLVDAGLRPVPHPFHILRHTFASHFVMSGGNILALKEILGHSDVKMTMIYAHLAPDFLDGEMDRVSF